MGNMPTSKEWDDNRRAGCRLFLNLWDRAAKGFPPGFDSDDAFKVATYPADRIVDPLALCWALGGSWVTDGSTVQLFARASALATVAKIPVKRRIWGALVQSGFQSEAAIDVSAKSAIVLNSAWNRYLDPVRAAHFVAEHHHDARDWDSELDTEIVLRRGWDIFSGGGVAFGSYGS